MNRQNKNKKGFTMIELVIVIAILAILAVAAAIAFSDISSAAEEAVDMSNAGTIVRTLNTYITLGGDPASIDLTGTTSIPLKLVAGTGNALVSIDLTLDLTGIPRLANVIGHVQAPSGTETKYTVSP